MGILVTAIVRITITAFSISCKGHVRVVLPLLTIFCLEISDPFPGGWRSPLLGHTAFILPMCGEVAVTTPKFHIGCSSLVSGLHVSRQGLESNRTPKVVQYRKYCHSSTS